MRSTVFVVPLLETTCRVSLARACDAVNKAPTNASLVQADRRIAGRKRFAALSGTERNEEIRIVLYRVMVCANGDLRKAIGFGSGLIGCGVLRWCAAERRADGA